jgi:putative hemolysin
MNAIDIVYLVLLVVLIGFSAAFSAADMAYSSVNKLRLERGALIGDKRSQEALHYANDYDKTIASILFGNDFVNILASTLAAILSRDIALQAFGEGHDKEATTIASFVLLFLLLVFGEITPKALAKPHNYAFARHMNWFVKISEIVFFPFVYPANKLAELIASPLIEKAPKEDVLASDDELQAMVDDISSEGIIDREQSTLLRNSLEFKETACYEIMTPRVNVFAYDIETPFADFLRSGEAFKHSRIPVYRGNLDHILGYLSTKSLLRELVLGHNPRVEDLLLPLVSVPRTMNISRAMALMKESAHHIAIVRDEYGGTEGIITLEDILEELVGEMWDESEAVSADVVSTDDPRLFRVKGTMNIDDFFKRFSLNDEAIDEDYSTVSGWINDKLGRFAKENDHFTYEDLLIRVTKASSYAVSECEVLYHPLEREVPKEEKRPELSRRSHAKKETSNAKKKKA